MGLPGGDGGGPSRNLPGSWGACASSNQRDWHQGPGALSLTGDSRTVHSHGRTRSRSGVSCAPRPSWPEARAAILQLGREGGAFGFPIRRTGRDEASGGTSALKRASGFAWVLASAYESEPEKE